MRTRSAAPASVLLLAVLITGCTTGIWSDSATMAASAAPTPRNNCERLFASHLTDGLGIPPVPPPSPEIRVLLPVLDSCTADELIEADGHFAFSVGSPMTYLLQRRLFNGQDALGQLGELCVSSALSATRSCSTLDMVE